MRGRGFRRGPARGFAPRAGPQPASQQVVEEQIQRPRDDGSKVAAGMGMAQQVARELELLFDASVGRELDSVALRRERLDAAARAGCQSSPDTPHSQYGGGPAPHSPTGVQPRAGAVGDPRVGWDGRSRLLWRGSICSRTARHIGPSV